LLKKTPALQHRLVSGRTETRSGSAKLNDRLFGRLAQSRRHFSRSFGKNASGAHLKGFLLIQFLIFSRLNAFQQTVANNWISATLIPSYST
ncbi:hypothetical protein M5U04_20825, partial [Xenorhabdus sp. XENO-1]|nr:hypothetical protein [Xenorhabdus bovienii subsp. africana]